MLTLWPAAALRIACPILGDNPAMPEFCYFYSSCLRLCDVDFDCHFPENPTLAPKGVRA